MMLKIAVKNILGSIISKSTKINNIVLSATLSMSAALLRLKARGINVRTIIDVGGSDGRWSMMAMKHYPEAFYYIIEANKIHEKSLKKRSSNLSNFDYVISAAGDKVGEIYFDDSDPFGGLASKDQTNSDLKTIHSATIDSEVRQKKLQPPFGIKLDTHGFEVPILEGARETLRETNFVVIETYNFKLNADECLRFPELCMHMEERGFRCIDIAEPMYRPLDKSFWQIDLFFVKATRAEFKSNSFK